MQDFKVVPAPFCLPPAPIIEEIQMAKRKKKRKKRVKHNLRRGQCKTINTPAGRRRLCKMKNGKVRFKKLSYGRG